MSPRCPWCDAVVGRSGHRCPKTPDATDLRRGDHVAGAAACRAAMASALEAVKRAEELEPIQLELAADN